MNKLVSIIIPCYNSEKYLHALLNSILAQTYSNLEVIIMDDGSTDASYQILEEYKELFKKKQITYKLLQQNNHGQAYAVNRCLKLIKGDYLVWVDSDDFFPEDSIYQKLMFLELNKEYGYVRSDVKVIYENGMNQSYLLSDIYNFDNECLFDNLIFEKDVYFCPGGYMVRVEALLSVIPKLDINTSRAGQNWQLLLPLSLRYRCGYINKVLFNYLVRDDSHSHNVRNFISEIEKCNAHQELLLSVLSELDIDEAYWKDEVIKKYNNKRISVSYLFKNTEYFKKLSFFKASIRCKVKFLFLLLYKVMGK